MMSLPTGCNGWFQTIATPRVNHLNRLAAMYGGLIFPVRPENAESGRHCGVSYRQDRPDKLRRRQPPARHSLPASCRRPWMTWFNEDCALFTLSSASRICSSARRAWVPVRFRVLQCAAGVGVVLNGDSNRPGRGTLVGKGLERLQVGPVRRGESQRDAGSVCHNGISWLVRRGQNDSISLARYRRLGHRSGNICYHLRAATWPGLDNNAIILQ